MELFFEIYRGKQHIFADVRESGTVADLKQIISGIIQIPTSEITIKRPTNDTRTSWETIDSDKALLELGFTQKNAKPDDPSQLAYTLPSDRDVVNIEPLSEPPPLHDALQPSSEF
ncbi:hypothetical protein M3Y97_00435100 [Aphelenchoides bicaudatus]|nr:hypothetical protein M3Y97_00435100 [Aphelenchoides bicaudatus]